MRILKTSAFCVLLTVCYLQTSAQKEKIPLNEPDYNKPKLFADLPERFNINVVALDALFNEQKGRSINVPLTPEINFHGVIVSRASDENANSKSIVIRFTNREGAIFTFTKFDHPDGKSNYIGRIVSRKHIDVYEIAQEKGQYVLQKKSLYDLMNE